MKKILIVTNGNIGDYVMATAALKLLRESLPSDFIVLIAIERVRAFVENLNFVDDCIYTNFLASKSIFRQRLDQVLWFIKTFFKLRKMKFDECIFLDHSRFLAKAVLFYSIKKTVGPSSWWCGKITNPNAKFLTTVIKLPKDSDKVHMSVRYQTIVKAYLKNYNLAMPVLPKTSNKIKEKVYTLLAKTKQYSLAFCLCGDKVKGNEKIYPLKYTLEIIKTLSLNFDIDFYFIGTKIFDKYSKAAKNTFPSLSIHNLCRKTTLLDLKSVFEQIDLLISVDTGAIHIAATTPIKVIGLYGNNTACNSGPQTHRGKILYRPPPCSPCNFTRTVLKIPCYYGNNPKCLENIMPYDVVNEVSDVFNQKNM
ncbi:MAG: glycosyltransferase family 9 protein [Elusimicrobiota bacterium]|jgi:ADP-heptose:LPS heptosyltransferase|nr:glycosyltransferase family 9 protein [Elusimicrobiota bacterium]